MAEPSSPQPGRSAQSGWARAGALALLLALAVPVFLLDLDAYGTINFDEVVYHYISRHMVESGDWTRLVTFGGEHVYDTFTKAPLQQWARAGLIAGLGDTYVSMRLLSALFGVATVLAVFGLARHLAGLRAGLLAGLVQLTTFQFVFLHGARTGESDSIACFLFVFLAWSFMRALEPERARNKRTWWLHHVALFALANVKLPLVLPALLAEGALLAITPAGRAGARRWLTTALLFAPLAFAWHIAQVVRLGPEALEVLRTMSKEAAGADDWEGPKGSLAQNALRYARVLLYGGAPAVFLAPLALARFATGPLRESARSAWCTFLAVPAAIAVFFLFVSKGMPWYVLPLFPFFAVAIGILLDEIAASRPAHPIWHALGAGAVAIALCTRFTPDDVAAFRDPAWRLDPSLSWRGGAASAAAIGALVVALASPLGRRVPPRALGWLLAVLTLGVAGARTTTMLGQLEFVSPLEQQALDLRARSSQGEEIHFPVPILGSEFRIARFFLADIYRVRRSPAGSAQIGTVEGLRKNLRRPLDSSMPVPRMLEMTADEHAQ